jgi:hypothetical protein
VCFRGNNIRLFQIEAALVHGMNHDITVWRGYYHAINDYGAGK